MFVAQILEAIMLVCFGLSWPLNAYKSFKAQTAAGSSWQFIGLITVGSLAGIAAKFVAGQVNWVLIVCFLNLVFLGVNWWVYFRNVHLDRVRMQQPSGGEELLEMPLEHAIIASDGSPASLKAALFAADALHLDRADVTIDVVSVSPDASSISRDKASDAVGGIVEMLRKKGITCGASVLQGTPAAEIVDAVEREKADFVIMGSRGLSGMEQRVLGSVSRSVIDHVACPVLVVK
jgi:nucleotide-binding universal stress UspA family protein